jgi:uncharacterized protein YbjQ (UPF0145 family)
MILSTAESIAGQRTIRTLGIVRGNTVRARHLGKDIVAALKNIVGGEIEEYTKLLGESRDQALDRMIAQAQEAGANAIVCIRFTTSYVMSNAAEIMVFGTAVVVEDEH